MAALTTATPVSKRYPQRIGTLLMWIGTLTGPASYTTGGDTINPALLGMNKIEGGIASMGSAGRVPTILPQTDGTAKLQVRTSNGAAPNALLDFTSTGNLSAELYPVVIFGH